MASGVYGKVNVSATTWTEVVAPPTAGNTKVTTLNVCNRGAGSVTVQIALSTDTTITDDEFIEYDVSIPAKGVLERTGIVLSENNGLYIYTSASDVTAVAYGLDG
tara:strand:+ start:292 stop:606 length:315 start_codon:yes stop_codon:yes gene_type:complete